MREVLRDDVGPTCSAANRAETVARELGLIP